MPRYTHEFYNQKLHVHCSRNQGHLQVHYEQFVIHRTFFCLYIVLNLKYHDIFNTIMLLLVRMKKKKIQHTTCIIYFFFIFHDNFYYHYYDQ